MNLSAVLALLAASLSTFVGLLAWRFRRAPGLQDQGWLALIAFTGAGYAALNVLITWSSADAGAVLWANKLQFLLVMVHVVAWFRYCSVVVGHPWPGERRVGWLLVGLAAPVLLPGVGFTGLVVTRHPGSLDVVYRDAEPTTYGLVLTAGILAIFVLMNARFALAWRRRVPYAGVHLAALSILSVMATNDGLTLAGVLHGYYLIDLGFLGPLAAVTYALSGRLVEESRALAALRARLERTVEERTAELASSRDALHRSEKLAALGQFSAGVSHEVSNPAAVVAANLRYLEEALRGGAAPADALDCLAESREAVERIARLTRQLLDASRLASAPVVLAERVVLAEAVAEALGAARTRLAGRPALVEVPADLCAHGQRQALVQVLDRLLDNAVRSLGPGASGRISVRAERALGRARLVVEDDGVGMTEETLSRAFDPFFSTRAFGTGTGLGLAVARGLLQSMRGDLRLESTPGRGTRAIVELPLADEGPPPATPPSGSPPPTA